eukprot:4354836-Alexandrium_andersonii.AAC.1
MSARARQPETCATGAHASACNQVHHVESTHNDSQVCGRCDIVRGARASLARPQGYRVALCCFRFMLVACRVCSSR